MWGLAVSDEPDELDKKELPERWESYPGGSGVLEAKLPEEGVINLIISCNKGQIKGKSLLDWPLEVPGDLCVYSLGTGSKVHRSYNCYPGCAHTRTYAY